MTDTALMWVLAGGLLEPVWVGVGALGSIIIGLTVFGEAIGHEGFLCLGMIVVGVVGMNLVSGGDEKA